MSEAEDRISWVEDTVRTDCDLHALQLQMKALKEKAVDTETASAAIMCRSWAYQSKQKAPGWLDLQNPPPTFVVERAHRVPPAPLIPFC